MSKQEDQGCLSGLISLILLAAIYLYLKETLEEVVAICLGALGLVVGLWWLQRVLHKREIQRRIARARREEERRIHALRLADVDNMDGREFERYVGRLLSHQGFRVEITKGSSDLGVDIIAQQNGIKYAIQAKRHGKNISRRAVSDAVAGKGYYNCNMAMVITNSYFTDGAKKLANSTGCELIDRDILASWILDFQRVEADKLVGKTGVPLETKKVEEETEMRAGRSPRHWVASFLILALIVFVFIALLSQSEEQREQASAPTSITTPTEKPTSTQEPPTPTTSVSAGTTPATSTPEPTPTSTQKPTTQKPMTTPTPIIYIVKAGDTLSAIAKEFGVTVEALQEVNAVSDPKLLQIGQELTIPQGEAVAGATATRVKAMPTPVALSPTPMSQRTMYFCGYEPCRDSGEYGQLVFETGINVWNNPEPERGGVHHQASHGDRVVVIEEKRVYDGPGGLWYKLQGGGWTNDLWLTDTLCTPDNLDEYSFTDCIMGEY